ncbi:hypothetical protein DRN46_03025 [Thermococci archaeon]|nr:MAG: hypothetical protein DRN46_03025 [Thermococci archaeon]
MKTHKLFFLLSLVIIVSPVLSPPLVEPQGEEKRRRMDSLPFLEYNETFAKEVEDLFLKVASFDIRVREKYGEESKRKLIEMGARAVPPLLDMYLETDVARRRVSLFQIIKGIGEEALPYLWYYMDNSENPKAVSRLAYLLGEIPSKESLPYLVSKLKEKERYREALGSIAYALGRIGDRRATPYLVELAKDEDVFVRKSAVVALGRLKDPEGIPVLIHSLEDDYHIVRYPASISLKEIGPETIDPLLDYLESDAPSIAKGYAIEVLGSIGAVEKDKVSKTLLELLHSEDPWLRAFSAEAIADLCVISAKKRLVSIMEKEKHPFAKQQLVEALEKLENCEKQ